MAPKYEELVTRLKETEWSGKEHGRPLDRGTTCWARNPDGVEAATAIRDLSEEVERLREALDLVQELRRAELDMPALSDPRSALITDTGRG